MSISYVEFLRRTASAVLIVGLTLLGALVLWNLRSIVLLGFTCWVISLALEIPVNTLQRRGIPRGYAVLIALTGSVIVITLMLLTIVPPFVVQFGNLAQDLPDAARDLVRRYEDLRAADEFATSVLPDFTEADYDALLESDTPASDTPAPTPDPAIRLDALADSALPVLSGIGSFASSVLANLLLIVFITIYFVLDPLDYYRGILALVPRQREERVLAILNELRRTVVNWMGTLAVSIVAKGALVTASMWALRIPNAFALGLIAGLTSFIPYLGYYLALIPITIFTAADDPAKLLPAILLYVITGEIEAKLITPSVIKNELNLPAGIVMLFQLAAATFLGFYGILMAVPILAIIVALVRELYVYDALDKRAAVPEVHENLDGQLVLKHPSPGPPPAHP